MANKKAAKATKASGKTKTNGVAKEKAPSKLALFHASKVVFNKKAMPENPGREGSKAFKYRDLYPKYNGKTVAELLKAGGHAGYLRGDVKRGYVTLQAPKQ